MEHCLHYIKGTFWIWQRIGVILNFLVLQYVERSQVGNRCSSTTCAAVYFGKKMHFKRKSRMFWVGRLPQRKVRLISDSYTDIESLIVLIGRAQLCWNTLADNLYSCVIFLIVFWNEIWRRVEECMDIEEIIVWMLTHLFLITAYTSVIRLGWGLFPLKPT